MIITPLNDNDFYHEPTPVANYIPEAIDEYLVIVNLPEDWEVVHNYIINENEIDGIPNRKIECINQKNYSLRSSVYKMSIEESEILKTHEKVESVELNPAKYPQPVSSDASRFGNNVAFPRPIISKLNTFNSATPTASMTNNVRANWSQIAVNNLTSEPYHPYRNVGITTTDSIDSDIIYNFTGKDVDAVVIDSGVSVLHPEFIASDGTYRVKDIILDGPMKIDPSAFSGYTETITIDGVNIGTRAQEARARSWWSNTSVRSAAFQSLGTINPSNFSNYTRVHAHSKNGTNPIENGHGTACASQIGGKYHGLAFECNLWNLRMAVSGSGFIAAPTALDFCTLFHKAKKIASNDPDPTILNCSFSSDLQTGNTKNTTYYHTFRTTNTSYTGTGTDSDGANFNNLIPSNSGACRNYAWMVFTNTAGSGFIERYDADNNHGGYYLNTAATSTSSAAEDAISEGCIVLAAAANKSQKLSDKTDVDFDNKYYGTSSSYSGGSFTNRVGGIQQGFSGDHDIGKGTIRVGGIDCGVEAVDAATKQGTEKYSIRKVSYSNDGPMIDIFAPAEATMAAGYANYESTIVSYQRGDNSSFYDYAFGGTSAACPNACAVVSLYLQQVRATKNQSEIRTWLTTTASKTGFLSDPISGVNDTGYFTVNSNTTFDLSSFGDQSLNTRGNGNLRGAPNRILFNPFAQTDSAEPFKINASNTNVLKLRGGLILK